AAELASRGPLPIATAIDYVLQACEAMAEAHRQGTVHRDLKPSNLFLTREGDRDFVKVLDFGVSKIAVEDVDLSVTTTRSALGTALYMSPEQVRSAKNVDPRTDVWSMGVVLYELLTARAPFNGESVTAVAAAIVADHPEPLSGLRGDLPAGFEEVLMRSLEKDRTKRYADCAAFAAALLPFQGYEESSVSPVVSGARANDGNADWMDEETPLEDVGQGRATTLYSPNVGQALGGSLGPAVRSDSPVESAMPAPQRSVPVERKPSYVANIRSRLDSTPESPSPIIQGRIEMPGLATAPRSMPPRPSIGARKPRPVVLGAGAIVIAAAISAIVFPKLAHHGFGSESPASDAAAAASGAVLVGVLPNAAQPLKTAADIAASAAQPAPSASAAMENASPPVTPKAPEARLPSPTPARRSAVQNATPRQSPPVPAYKPTTPTPTLPPTPAPRPAKPAAPKSNVDLPDNPG
ncbi:MAG TPA: serine/threonine-protein kinase, partial [Polyangiaceae bacterium]